jgi:hypothetical protein
MNTEASTEKLIPGGILFALMTQRKELLGMTMRDLRKQAAEGTLTGAPLEHVLNALEGVCETLIEDGLERRGFASDMDDEDEE